MRDLGQYPAYSYRDDPDVPEFPDEHPVVFMDGECALCSRAARLIVARDKSRSMRICPTQSELAHSVFAHYQLDASDPETWLYLEHGRPWTSMAGIIRVGRQLGGLARTTEIFALLPARMQNWLYLKLAQNRYRLFGHTDMCSLPDPELQKRLLR